VMQEKSEDALPSYAVFSRAAGNDDPHLELCHT
jgi:hypothetical protein